MYFTNASPPAINFVGHLASFGRSIMFNLGFGDLVGKFEEYFGKTTTGWMLGLVGASFTIFAVGLTCQTIIIPLLGAIGGFILGAESYRTIAAGFNLIAALLSVAMIAFLASSIFINNNKIRAAEKDSVAIAEISSKADIMFKKYDEASDELKYALLHVKDLILDFPGGEEKVKQIISGSPLLTDLWSDDDDVASKELAKAPNPSSPSPA